MQIAVTGCHGLVGSALLPLLVPISILIVPFADLVLAVIRRTRAGRPPLAPDKQHLHHRLLEIGHSQRRAVLIMWMWAALVAFGLLPLSITVLDSMEKLPVAFVMTALLFIRHRDNISRLVRGLEPKVGGK